MALHDDAERLATIIRDYREGEVPRPDADHVLRWIGQFPAPVREPLLAEATHVLQRSYVNRAAMLDFLRSVATDAGLAGRDPAAFWRGVTFLRVQEDGNSQREMLAMLDQVLTDLYGLTTSDCRGDDLSVYLDDGLFSGNRIATDLIRWIERQAPAKARIAVIVIAEHRYGCFNTNQRIEAAAATAGKRIEVHWWHLFEVEDRKARTNASDVLRPKRVPAGATPYADGLRYPPVLRHGDQIGPHGLYSSAIGRDLIEQEFLKGGIEVLRRCQYLREKPFMRPLGAMPLATLGFGTMFVTYRNVPNNAPLVLWAGNPWYPLFPRKTNVK